jgi:hypothetical protein
VTLAPSGTNLFQISTADMVLEAFERIQIYSPALTTEKLVSARRSMNLSMQAAANRGVTLFAVQQATPITLVTGTPTYNLPTNCVQVLDTYYSIPNGDGTYTDRIMLPMTRTEYAEIPQKLVQAPPNRYWFQRTETPSLTTWQVYDGSSPGALISYFYMRQIYDANMLGSEAPDMLARWWEAYIADLTARLAEKWAPAQLEAKLAVAKLKWDEAAEEDREQPGIKFRPNFRAYMRRR